MTLLCFLNYHRTIGFLEIAYCSNALVYSHQQNLDINGVGHFMDGMWVEAPFPLGEEFGQGAVFFNFFVL